MKIFIAILFVTACTTAEPSPSADAAIAVFDAAACVNNVVATCGPRPPRPTTPDPQINDRWGHDIDLWAKCAEFAQP